MVFGGNYRFIEFKLNHYQKLLFLADDTALNKVAIKDGLTVFNPRVKNAVKKLEAALKITPAGRRF